MIVAGVKERARVDWIERREERRLIGGLAGLKRIAVLPFRLRRKSKKKKTTTTASGGGGRVRVKLLMDIWHKMIFPLRRLCLALSARLNSHKNGAGLLKLQDDVQTCGYEDVQVMWEMLQKTESEVVDNQHKRKQLPFWRIFVWSNQGEASSASKDHP